MLGGRDSARLGREPAARWATRTDQPQEARSRAAAAPAGPPPITNTSTMNDLRATLRPHVPGVNVLCRIGKACFDESVMAFAALAAQAAVHRGRVSP